VGAGWEGFTGPFHLISAPPIEGYGNLGERGERSSEEGKNLGLDHHRQDGLTSERSEGVRGKFL